jgi:hypothetical protein
MRIVMPPTINPDVPNPWSALLTINDQTFVENAIPEAAPQRQNPPIENKSDADSLDDNTAKAGPQSMFRKLFIEIIRDRSWREIP